jgi:hypothetical protein
MRQTMGWAAADTMMREHQKCRNERADARAGWRREAVSMFELEGAAAEFERSWGAAQIEPSDTSQAGRKGQLVEARRAMAPVKYGA